MRDGALEMKRVAPMHRARCKPFLVSPLSDGFFAIGGFYHPRYMDSISKDCEQYIESEDHWEELAPLNYPPKSVFAISIFIYASSYQMNSENSEPL